jgi:hypothetical protein
MATSPSGFYGYRSTATLDGQWTVTTIRPVSCLRKLNVTFMKSRKFGCKMLRKYTVLLRKIHRALAKVMSSSIIRNYSRPMPYQRTYRFPLSFSVAILSGKHHVSVAINAFTVFTQIIIIAFISYNYHMHTMHMIRPTGIQGCVYKNDDQLHEF